MKNWLVWRLLQRPGDPKPRKVPFYAGGGARSQQGTEDDRAQLVSYDEAVLTAEMGGFTGVGFAVLPDSGVVALDFDDCVIGGQIDHRVAALCEGTYTEISPSGTGVRAFMRGKITSRKDTKAERGPFAVEVFGDSGFVTFTGKVTDDCAMWGHDQTVAELTPPVLAMYRDRWGDPLAGQGGTSNDDWLLGHTRQQQTLGLDLAELRTLLFACDPNAGREQWLNALMAVHHETGGSDEGQALCDEWSAQSPKYGGPEDVDGRWRSFGKASDSKQPLTAAWLKKWAKECASAQRYDVRDAWKKRIAEASSEREIRETICPQIIKDPALGKVERESLAQALKERFKLLGNTYAIATCKEMLVEKREQKAPLVAQGDDDTHLPPWLRNWFYITDEDRFMNIETGEKVTMQGFNAKFNRHLVAQSNESGEKVAINAGWMALEKYCLRTVATMRYMPGVGNYFIAEGLECANKFRAKSVPARATHYTDRGREAIRRFQFHISLICGGRKFVSEMFTSWLAHNVKYPGAKIRWSPLIKGIEGDGKSIFSNVMAMVLGSQNTGIISSKVIGTDYNGWAEGVIFAVLEELRVIGHSRYDTANALKPNITNEEIEIHRKGRDPYKVNNTVNYLGLTNYADALPLTETDRRWMIIFSPFSHIREMGFAVRDFGGVEAYFDSLFDLLKENASEIARWFYEYELHAEFSANGRAPSTDEKVSMVALSVGMEEAVIREVIERGAYGVTENVLASRCLSAAVALEDSEIELNTTTLNRILVKLGYVKLPKRVKWDGTAHLIWVKGKVQSWGPGLKAILDKTLVSDDGSSISSELVLDLFN